jgi:hypothetical protein
MAITSKERVGRPFEKGVSGNPGGRPKERLQKERRVCALVDVTPRPRDCDEGILETHSRAGAGADQRLVGATWALAALPRSVPSTPSTPRWAGCSPSACGRGRADAVRDNLDQVEMQPADLSHCSTDNTSFLLPRSTTETGWAPSRTPPPGGPVSNRTQWASFTPEPTSA